MDWKEMKALVNTGKLDYTVDYSCLLIHFVIYMKYDIETSANILKASAGAWIIFLNETLKLSSNALLSFTEACIPSPSAPTASII